MWKKTARETDLDMHVNSLLGRIPNGCSHIIIDSYISTRDQSIGADCGEVICLLSFFSIFFHKQSVDCQL